MSTRIALAAACIVAAPACTVNEGDAAIAAAPQEPNEIASTPERRARPKPRRDDPTSRPHPEMVEIRPSLIPGAGQGLFARVDIPEGTYIGFYSGDLVTAAESDALAGTKQGEYLFFLPDCAADEMHDSIAGDMNDYISKVNYAPDKINRQSTLLQNVAFEYECEEPYVRLYATRGIAADEELYVDYGSAYDYAFMQIPAVQDYFLHSAWIDREDEFTWDHGEAE